MIMGVMLLASCGSVGSGALTGTMVGGMFGSAIGGIGGGYRGSDVGTLVGMAAGAAAGAAIGAAAEREANTVYVEERPVVIEERVVERPVVVERIVERPVYVERRRGMRCRRVYNRYYGRYETVCY